MKLLLMVLFLFSTIVMASGQSELSKIMNIAGKQRMLSQRIAKNALFIASGINKAESVKDMRKAMSNFSLALNGLQNGNALLGIVKVDNVKIQTQLSVVSRIWKSFEKEIKLVVAGKSTRATLKKIAKDSVPLLSEMNKAVGVYAIEAQKSASGKLSAEKTVAINLSGKQRMLSQKMTKELLQVSLSLEKTASLSDLETTVSLFDKTLNGLISGEESLKLVASTNSEILVQLEKVKNIWKNYEPILLKSIKEKNVDIVVLEKVYILNVDLLNSMNRAVGLIEKKFMV